ncbi:hypothetical protein AVEN_90149-1 [Araneus ventricosus]|uniref:Uncharacterized protein n=1 Tax=Araneus ventricosus TaxID=182803 RepID=A0A4Y2P049_ARAVE|nr:hypothetical protein AVEN_90149-1 [Araneus ventricosus]
MSYGGCVWTVLVVWVMDDVCGLSWWCGLWISVDCLGGVGYGCLWTVLVISFDEDKPFKPRWTFLNIVDKSLFGTIDGGFSHRRLRRSPRPLLPAGVSKSIRRSSKPTAILWTDLEATLDLWSPCNRIRH